MADIDGTTPGISALWTGFGFTLFATVVFIAIAAMHAGKKGALIAQLAVIIVASSALCYLIEALNGDLSAVSGNNGRAFQWLRYAQWAFNTPLLVATLGLLAGTTAAELFYTTALSWLTTGALFAAALSSGYNATWPIYAFGVAMAIPVIIMVFTTWSSRANGLPAATKTAFNILSILGFVLAVGYAINWGTAEGGQKQDADQELITYTVLDIASRVVFGFILLFVPGAIDSAAGFIKHAHESEATAAV